MIFTQRQVQQILEVIDYHHLFVFATNFGVDILSDEDKNILSLFGVNIGDLSKDTPLYNQMYYFGRLSSILKDKQTETVDFNDFFQYIIRGQYIPLSQREKFELNISKRRTYTYLKGLKEKVKSSVEGSILEQEQKYRQLYEDTVKQGLSTGVIERKSVTAIVSDLGHKMETFKHDWGRIVETEMNNIFLEGRAMEIMSQYGENVMVWKQVFSGACRHCIEKYLTNGLGSKPRLYKLKDLIANGDNIGKKVKDWKPTIQSLHPFCRCLLKFVIPGYVWDEEKQRFDVPKNFVRKVERKSKIRVQVGEKFFEV